jgi:hypothetical protein
MPSRSRIDSGLEKALAKLKATDEYRRYVHGERCLREIRHVLSQDEDTIMEIRQSHLRNITPERIIATNRRLIIVRPSFFGHYFGFDLLRQTDVSFVPYKQLISIVMSHGKFLSTIHMRIHGFTDVSSAIRNEGEVDGVRTSLATKFTIFIEELIENEEAEGETAHDKAAPSHLGEGASRERAIDLEAGRELVKQKGGKFVWLGIEPSAEVAATLDVSEGDVERMDMSSIANMPSEELQKYGECVFVSYDSVLSDHVVRYLKKKHGVYSYSLNRGIMHAARTKFEKFS